MKASHTETRCHAVLPRTDRSQTRPLPRKKMLLFPFDLFDSHYVTFGLVGFGLVRFRFVASCYVSVFHYPCSDVLDSVLLYMKHTFIHM